MKSWFRKNIVLVSKWLKNSRISSRSNAPLFTSGSFEIIVKVIVLLATLFAIPICISSVISIVIFSSGSNRTFSSSSSCSLLLISPSDSSPKNNSKPSMLFDLLTPFSGIRPLITSFIVFGHGLSETM